MGLGDAITGFTPFGAAQDATSFVHAGSKPLVLVKPKKTAAGKPQSVAVRLRSEERRVGKEC